MHREFRKGHVTKMHRTEQKKEKCDHTTAKRVTRMAAGRLRFRYCIHITLIVTQSDEQLYEFFSEPRAYLQPAADRQPNVSAGKNS